MTPEIWQKIREGDAAAMKALYQQSYQELYAYGFRVVADKDKIKDCLHEVFCEIWQRRDNIGEVISVIAYLKTCVRNKLLSVLKQDLKTDPLDQDQQFEALAERSYEELLISAETDADAKIKIWQAINQLTPMQREIVKLKFFDELSYEAIALALNLKPRTVYNHIYAAICALKSHFKN